MNKSTIIFKINIFKLLNKYTKLINSSLALDFLKIYLKDIKEICNENPSDFELVNVICLRKPFLKLSLQFIMLQKYSDKFYCKSYKIF